MKSLFLSFCIVLILFEGVHSQLLAVDDQYYTDVSTPLCVPLLNNDITTSNTTVIPNNPVNGFVNTSYPPFYLANATTLILEAENYQGTAKILYSNWYDNNTDSSYWQSVSTSMYNDTSGTGAVRAWPNVGITTSTNFYGPALLYNVAFQAIGPYNVWARGRNCYGCASNSCPECLSMSTSDDVIHYLYNTTTGSFNFGSNGTFFGSFANDTWVWIRNLRTMPVATADVISWPPKLFSFYLAFRRDGVVIDKFAMSNTGTNFSSWGIGGQGSPQSTFINCSSNEILYFPPKSWVGMDSFNYTISNGTASSTATVYMYVGTPIPSPSPTPSVTPSPSSSVTPSITPTSSVSPTASVTPTRSVTPSVSTTPSVSPTRSPSPTASVTPSGSPTSSVTPSPTPTSSTTPTPSPSSSSTPSPSSSPSATPSITPTSSTTPSISPSASPSLNVTSSTHVNSQNTIIGAAAGVVGFTIIAFGSVVLFLLHRQRKLKNKQPTDLTDISMSKDNLSNSSISLEDIYRPMGSTISSFTSVSKLNRSNFMQSWLIDFSELKIEQKVGKGAFGEVFKAKWKGIDVAVKRVVVDKDVDIQDFFAEAELMKTLRPHPNITQLMGVCESPICIITEFVHNGSLSAWLYGNKPMDDEMKINIVKGIVTGMLYLHSEGVIHRDLAARNILLTSSLQPKVSDFGMSRVTLDDHTNKTSSDIGPIRWMKAPEALSDRVYNTKTDIWSFGVVVYEILTRKIPFAGVSLIHVAANVVSGKLSLIPEIQEAADNYPDVLVKVLMLCLNREPKKRPEFSSIIQVMEGKEPELQEAIPSEDSSES